VRIPRAKEKAEEFELGYVIEMGMSGVSAKAYENGSLIRAWTVKELRAKASKTRLETARQECARRLASLLANELSRASATSCP